MGAVAGRCVHSCPRPAGLVSIPVPMTTIHAWLEAALLAVKMQSGDGAMVVCATPALAG